MQRLAAYCHAAGAIVVRQASNGGAAWQQYFDCIWSRRLLWQKITADMAKFSQGLLNERAVSHS